MKPRNPGLWFVSFVCIIFVMKVGLNIAYGEPLALVAEGVWALVTGGATLGLLFLADKARTDWFARGDGRQQG